MKTTTTADRIAALVAFINADDVRQGRPDDVEPRTAADLDVKVSADHVGGRILTAYIDNHCPCEPFVVVTIDEAATAKEICLERDLTEDDCITVNGVTYVVVYVG